MYALYCVADGCSQKDVDLFVYLLFNFTKGLWLKYFIVWA